jgi:4-hydroxybenzoate polyprenyltransferase
MGVSNLRKIRLFLRMIMFEHTIFALPYAYLGMILASYSEGHGMPGWRTFWFVTLAMVGARSAAMGLNRIIDKAIDARNPRTANRELPRGVISVAEAGIFVVASFALLAYAAWMLNPLCFKLLPVAMLVLTIYPYTKRFTWACHFILGIADGLAPLGGWIAVTGAFAWPAVVLAAAVAAWIAGFDLIYACQDVEFDRAHRIYSIPARFGISAGLWVSRVLDMITILLLLLLPRWVSLGPLYYLGVAAVAGLLFYEHRIISPSDMSRIDVAFFKVNSYVASVAFVFTLLDVLVHLY